MLEIQIWMLGVGLVWEFVAPIVKPGSVTDLWDLMSYQFGGILYYLIIILKNALLKGEKMKKSGILDKVLLIVEMILLACAFYFYSSEGEINGLSIFLFVLSLIIAVARSILLLKKKIKPKTNSEKTEESDVDIPKTNNDKEKKATQPHKTNFRFKLYQPTHQYPLL